MSSLYDEWNNKRIFKIEKDRFKKKKYIYTSPFKTICRGFNNFGLYPYVLSDLYSKMYRMKGYNVLYSVLVNNLNDDTVSYSRQKGESFQALKNYYVRELCDMGIGFDEEKLISYSDEGFITFVQKLFKAMYDDGVVSLKKKECFTDFSGLNIYPKCMVTNNGEKYVLKENDQTVYLKNIDVLVINTSKLGLIDDIKEYDIDQSTKNKMLSLINSNEGLIVPFSSADKNVTINVSLENPEYMGGVGFIALNPKYIDIMPYVSEDEENFIREFIECNDSDSDMYTGVTVLNPLTGAEVYVFASYKYDSGIHVGIPALNTLDSMFISGVGIDSIDILEDARLINSDFLNGMTPSDANKEIIGAFKSEGMCETFEYSSDDEVVISSFEELGVIIPVASNSMQELSVLDEKFYPIYYSPRLQPIVSNEDKLDNNLTLKRMVFNQGFLCGAANIYARVYDMYGSNDELLTSKSPFDLFQDEMAFLSSDSAFDEIFYSIIFNKYLKSFGKNYIPFSKINIINDTVDRGYIDEQQRLGFSFADEILNKFSADAYRLYLFADSLNHELSLTLSNIEKYQDIIDRIRDAYEKPFEVSGYDNSYANSYISEQNRLLEAFEVKKYTNNLISFFETFVETHRITKNESYNFLITLSLIAPEISEEINKQIFKERYSIFYNEFPR